MIDAGLPCDCHCQQVLAIKSIQQRGAVSRLRVRCVLEGLVVLVMSPTLKQHQLPLLATTLHAPE